MPAPAERQAYVCAFRWRRSRRPLRVRRSNEYSWLRQWQPALGDAGLFVCVGGLWRARIVRRTTKWLVAVVAPMRVAASCIAPTALPLPYSAIRRPAKGVAHERRRQVAAPDAVR